MFKRDRVQYRNGYLPLMSQIVEDIYDISNHKISMNHYTWLFGAIKVYYRKLPIFVGSNCKKTHKNYWPHYDELKCGIISYVDNVARNLSDFSKESLLIHYAKEWEKFKYSSKYMTHLFAPFDRAYVKVLRDIGCPNILYVEQLSMFCWKEALKFLIKPLADACLVLIENERNGETINTGLIKTFVFSLVDMGYGDFKNDTTDGPFLNVYKDEFEERLLDSAQIFYLQESDAFVKENSLIEYMKKAEIRLEEESSRVKRYLHFSTHQLMQNVCVEILVKNKLDRFKEKFLDLVEENKAEDWRRLFRLVSKIPHGMNELYSIFENSVRSQGLEAIEAISNTAESDPKLYIRTILDVLCKNKKIVDEAFEKSVDFKTALNKGCKIFINQNEVTKKSKHYNKSAELLAKYCDLLLKKNNKDREDIDLEDSLDKVMEVFCYIEDVDVFQHHYSKFLAKRLIFQSSASDEAEASMISKLKVECGNSYTLKLQRMFQDIENSKDLTTKFKANLKHRKQSLGHDISVLVLSTGSWPFPKPVSSLVLPQELENSLRLFEEFYNVRHPGRKLKWMYNISKGELVTNCYRNRYTIQASTFQMTCLLAFNSADILSLQELHKVTELDLVTLIQVLETLLKANLLTSEAGANLDNNSSVAFNPNYKNKKLKININVALKVESKVDDEATRRKINENREFVIFSNLFQIMKTRKIASHKDLINELLGRLKKNFVAENRLIKKVITNLIDKKFIKRSKKRRDSYEYVV